MPQSNRSLWSRGNLRLDAEERRVRKVIEMANQEGLVNYNNSVTNACDNTHELIILYIVAIITTLILLTLLIRAHNKNLRRATLKRMSHSMAILNDTNVVQKK